MTTSPSWTLEQISRHIADGLPLAPLFNLEVVEATPARALLRLNEGAHVTRPGGSVAGPVLFALADVVTYARVLPLLAEAVPLRAGRRLFTAEVRISEADGTGALVAQATTTWSLAKREA